MLATNKLHDVKRLLAEGAHSQREIARLTGVSRGVISMIASGERPDYESHRLARAEEEWQPIGPPARCTGCGGRVQMPCLLCRVREITEREFLARRERRRRTREVALKKLLAAVWRASLEREARLEREGRGARPRECA